MDQPKCETDTLTDVIPEFSNALVRWLSLAAPALLLDFAEAA